MGRNRIRVRGWALALSVVGMLAGCGSRQPPAAAPAAAPAATAAAVPAARLLAVNSQVWTPEAMEALLAPIALYPDPVLSQVLIAATNPQEVLDAGNWLIDHPDLADKALDQAATQTGFTPPMRALMQFRQIVDQMCLKMGWTTELGQAFTNDQAGVLAAVQRLRRQAQDAGNLQDSPQMTVETRQQGGQQAIVISPPSPQVVYVPQYDAVTAYAPAPAIDTYGDGTGEMATTGVLAFGAGLIVGNVFDHDEDDYYQHGYYYPNYGYGRYPPCPPRHYRPVYGNGHRPGHYYNRPPHYEDTLRDHDFLVDGRRSDEYWNHFDERPTDRPRANSVPSPITAARMNRAPPTQFAAEGNAPMRLPQSVTATDERLSGSPRPPADAGAEGQRPVERDREQRYHEDGQGARLQGGAQEPPKYSAAPARHARGGDREPPTSRATPWQQHPAEVRPDDRESAPPRPAPPPNFPSARFNQASAAAARSHADASMPPSVVPPPARMGSPPPATSGDGKRGHAASGSSNGGVDRSAGPRAHGSDPPATSRNAGVELQH